jgi:hypothetical protein
MAYPSFEASKSIIDLKQNALGAAEIAAGELRETPSLPRPQARMDDEPSPVCAACWAY